MKENPFTLAELGTIVHLFAKHGEFHAAQKALRGMQVLLDSMRHESKPMSDDARLDCSDYPETVVVNNAAPALNITEEDVAKHIAKPKNVMVGDESSAGVGPILDDEGHVVKISTQPNQPGYDPDAHRNENLKIFCDGVHMPTAHTADVIEGKVRYYEKNGKGRIKTLEKHGKVEITGI